MFITFHLFVVGSGPGLDATLHLAFFFSQKVHTFQKSLEAVMQRLVEAKREQSVLGQVETFSGVTENEILLVRNQLKVINSF